MSKCFKVGDRNLKSDIFGWVIFEYEKIVFYILVEGFIRINI